MDKVAKRLGGWKKGFLSKGGKLTLLQSVLSANLIYYMSLCKMPIGVRMILKRRCGFFCGRISMGQNIEGEWLGMCVVDPRRKVISI